MATILRGKASRRVSLAVSRYDQLLAGGSLLMLLAVLAALVRGAPHWASVPALIWAHLFTIIVALALTPAMMLRPRGDRPHRALGTIWVAAMTLTAGLSLGITVARPGHWTAIHLLSVFTLVMAPMIWWTARTHQVARHQRSVRAMVTGALLIAGFFTFPFDRLLGHWLFS